MDTTLEPRQTDFQEEYLSNKHFTADDLQACQFEDCQFDNCQFIDCDLSALSFSSCRFNNCDFRLCKVSETVFSDIEFNNSRLQGINFADANYDLFWSDFYSCEIHHSIFQQLRLKKKSFRDCTIKDSDFFSCDLEGCSFKGSTFIDSNFGNCNLKNCDFSTAKNYSISPEQNQVKGAIFSLPDAITLLSPLQVKIKK